MNNQAYVQLNQRFQVFIYQNQLESNLTLIKYFSIIVLNYHAKSIYKLNEFARLCIFNDALIRVYEVQHIINCIQAFVPVLSRHFINNLLKLLHNHWINWLAHCSLLATLGIRCSIESSSPKICVTSHSPFHKWLHLEIWTSQLAKSIVLLGIRWLCSGIASNVASTPGIYGTASHAWAVSCAAIGVNRFKVVLFKDCASFFVSFVVFNAFH